MTTYTALLRAINVGGTGKLPMARLKAICEDAELTGVRTYIASGNVVFDSEKDEMAVKMALRTRLEAYAGRPVGVLVRTAAEMAAVLDRNPFSDRAAKWTVAIFLDEPPRAGALEDVRGMTDEEIVPGAREIYVHYTSGMGRSKLKIPAAASGTARNMNTIAKLVELAGSRR
ncbi:DUF1697 domain-containing protein [Microbaculum marinum]|uniref:DUF1697 domain-containing protein n=1 Tax=Microbaculum marinum TaxID=1764581 RepID=A0AAW9RQD8_9HYPH